MSDAAEQLENAEEQQEEEAEQQRRPEWIKHEDVATGEVYYMHSKTKEVRFESDDGDDAEAAAEEQKRQEQRNREKKAKAKAKARMTRRREARSKDRRFDPNDRQRKPPTPNTLFRQAMQDERAVSRREQLRAQSAAKSDAMSRGMRSTRSLADLEWKSGTLDTLNRSLAVELPAVSQSLEKLSLVEQYNVRPNTSSHPAPSTHHTAPHCTTTLLPSLWIANKMSFRSAECAALAVA